MSDFTGLEHIDISLAEKEPTDTDGNISHHTYLGNEERYLFDTELDDTWEQFDTDSDRWFFGVWTNKQKLRILCYVEGDLNFTQYKDATSYDAAILKMCKFHGPKACISTIGQDGTLTRYYQDRRGFFIDPENYPLDARSAWETDDEEK